MRFRAVVIAISMLACSNDTFVGSEGGVDAGNEGASDAPIVGDAIAQDGGTTPPCEFDGGTTCGLAQDCAPLACCIGAVGAACTASTTCPGGVLGCLHPSDCDAGDVCCLTPTNQGFGCPHVLAGGSSQCVVAGTCDQGSRRVCTSDSDCEAPQTCKRAVYPDAGVFLGICL